VKIISGSNGFIVCILKSIRPVVRHYVRYYFYCHIRPVGPLYDAECDVLVIAKLLIYTHLQSASTLRCLSFSVSVSRITHECVYGCRPNMAGMAKG